VSEPELSDPDFLLPDLTAWARDHRSILERIVDKLLLTGAWPSPTGLTRELSRQGQPVAVRSLMFGTPRPLGFVETNPERVVLLVFGLRMTGAANDLLSGFYEVVSLARERYSSEAAKPVVTRRDVAQRVSHGDTYVTALSEILLREAPFFGSGTGVAVEEWEREVTEDIVRYWEAQDIEGYLRTRAEELRISPPSRPVVLSEADNETEEARQGEDAPDTHDVFICHASEDKDAVARPLAAALAALGYSTWLDESELVIGESLNESIEDSLAHCQFGVVILSRAFFAKRWTKRELAGMTSREMIDGQRMILPIWHEINSSFLVDQAPMLADLLAGRTEDGIDQLAAQISRAIHKRRRRMSPGS
jgi:hypothetical protein